MGCYVTSLAKTKGAALPTLLVPDTFSTSLGRPWLVDIFNLPVWVRGTRPRWIDVSPTYDISYT